MMFPSASQGHMPFAPNYADLRHKLQTQHRRQKMIAAAQQHILALDTGYSEGEVSEDEKMRRRRVREYRRRQRLLTSSAHTLGTLCAASENLNLIGRNDKEKHHKKRSKDDSDVNHKKHNFYSLPEFENHRPYDDSDIVTNKGILSTVASFFKSRKKKRKLKKHASAAVETTATFSETDQSSSSETQVTNESENGQQATARSTRRNTRPHRRRAKQLAAKGTLRSTSEKLSRSNSSSVPLESIPEDLEEFDELEEFESASSSKEEEEGSSQVYFDFPSDSETSSSTNLQSRAEPPKLPILPIPPTRDIHGIGGLYDILNYLQCTSDDSGGSSCDDTSGQASFSSSCNSEFSSSTHSPDSSPETEHGSKNFYRELQSLDLNDMTMFQMSPLSSPLYNTNKEDDFNNNQADSEGDSDSPQRTLVADEASYLSQAAQAISNAASIAIGKDENINRSSDSDNKLTTSASSPSSSNPDEDFSSKNIAQKSVITTVSPIIASETSGSPSLFEPPSTTVSAIIDDKETAMTTICNVDTNNSGNTTCTSAGSSLLHVTNVIDFHKQQRTSCVGGGEFSYTDDNKDHADHNKQFFQADQHGLMTTASNNKESNHFTSQHQNETNISCSNEIIDNAENNDKLTVEQNNNLSNNEVS